jgi:thioredoxin reductase (NADPH)
LARNLGAELDATGQIVTDLSMRTSVKGLYAAGCLTEANCQMIIAAGQGAAAAQAINRELFEETWLRKPRRQLRRGLTSMSPRPTSNTPH